MRTDYLQLQQALDPGAPRRQQEGRGRFPPAY